MRFQYHDLYDRQFEDLTVAIGVELLGPAMQGFSEGKDGGRDGRFEGTALKFPSSAAPHNGKFIVQAKHTLNPVAKFSDPDFSGTGKSSTLSKEIPRLKRLVKAGEAEHYLLFSNRRLAANAEAKIRGRILQKTGVGTVELFGIERIDLLLRDLKGVAARLQLSELNTPLRVTPDDLANVIEGVARAKKAFASARADADKIERVPFAKKNQVNKLTDAFAKRIVSDFLPQFEALKHFLARPDNAEVLGRYLDACAEFQDQIIAHRGDFKDFDNVLVRIQSLLFDRDGDLARNKRLTKLVLYYMYWNCDIGSQPDSA